MRSKRERRYYRSQVCPHLDGLERSSDAPSKKEKMIFYKKNSFKGCMKLEFEPPRVKNDGNLEEVVPLLWCSERQILSVMEAERHMLKRRKISTTPKPGGCTVLKYEQMLRPKQVWREIIHTKRTPWAPIHHTPSKQPLEAGIVL